MELIYGIQNLHDRHRPCVATIGAFDGIHLGHQALLDQVKYFSNAMQLPSTVIVFEPLPREFFSPLHSPARLTSFRERFIELTKQSIDRVLLIPFSKKTSQISADDFVEKVFVDGLGVKQIVIGDDLRFGRDRQGDFNSLIESGKKNNFGVAQSQTFSIDGERVSSTRIRKALESADFTLAKKLLGRAYTICGKVVVGRQLGRELNAPTANVKLHRFRSALSGVYAVSVKLSNGDIKQGVANIGTRPTVDDSIKAILEVHILEFNADIYGQHIEVKFFKKIRDEKQFSGLEQLKVQIHEDISWAKNYFAENSNIS